MPIEKQYVSFNDDFTDWQYASGVIIPKQRGLMIEPAGRWNQVIRFLAPLVITEEQLEWGLDAMEASILACMDK